MLKTTPLKQIQIFIIFLLFTSISFSQVILFSEDFEAETNAEFQLNNTSHLGWQNFNITGNNNSWWIFDNSRSTAIGGDNNMAISQNNPHTGGGARPRYNQNTTSHNIAYYDTQIDASNHTNLTIDFNWICEGEGDFLFIYDFGRVCWSLDGTNWTDFTNSGDYLEQSTVQSVTNLDISELDGQQFYLGFRWINDGSVRNNPSFIVDDIFVRGITLTPCVAPATQPTALNLTPTSDTIDGTFTAAVPAPDNYLVVVSTSATPPALSGTYTNGQVIDANATVVDTDNNTTFTATGLNASTLYYIYVFAYNSLCGGNPAYNLINPLTGNTTTLTVTYCQPLTSTNASALYIDDVEFIGTLNDVSNNNNSFTNTPSGYQDFTGLTNSIQAQGEGVNIYVEAGTFRGRYKAWVDWNKDSTFNDDASEIVYDSGGIATATTTFGFVIPPGQAVGDYRIRIRFYNALGDYNPPGNNCDIDDLENYISPISPLTSCNTFGTFVQNINPPGPCPGRNVTFTEYGETEDYLFTVVESCAAQITSVTDASRCGPGELDLIVTGTPSATSYNWYTDETGGSLVANTATGTFTPNINTTTTYWVTALNGSCESLVRTEITAVLDPVTDITITPGTLEICGEDDILEISANSDTEISYLIDEDFESGGIGPFTVFNFDANGGASNGLSEWQIRSSTFVPSQQVWFPAISSGFGSNNFLMATSDIDPPSGIVFTSLESDVIDTSLFSDLTLNFDMYFSKYLSGVDPDDVYVSVSIDGGTNWIIAENYDDDIGFGTNFSNLNVDLSAYIGEPNFKVAIDYFAIWADGVAIDNIKLFGSRPLAPAFNFSTAGIAFEDVAATMPYTNGTQIGTVYVKPTLAQLEQSTITFTADASLSNGCNVSKEIVITNNTKIWNGNDSSSWEDPDNWYPNGVPTSSNCVIVRDVGGNPSPQTGAPLPPNPKYAYNLNVKNGGVLELGSQRSLTVTDAITVDTGGLFYVKNNGSLVQINDVPNSGDIFVERAPANGGAINNLNYVYWSTPVTGFDVDNISPNSTTGQKWQWLPTTADTYGNWDNASGLTMTNGKGYIIRGLSGVTANPTISLTSNSALFNGVPNNGNISIPIYHGNYNSGDYPGFNGVTATNSDDNWNLIGNPFPSSISADAFIDANAAIINDDPASAPIIGAIWFWPHAGIPLNTNNDPFYDDFAYNYGDQYIKHNKTGTSIPGGPTDVYIASGQAFFVLADHSADPSGADSVIFNNGMRDETFSNSNFFEAPPNTDLDNSDNTIQSEKNRIWLDLLNSNNNAKSILLGYIENATNGNDRMYDAPEFSGSAFSFYSIIENDIFSIQGKSLPFNDTDSIPLGIVIPNNAIYSIAINTLDGLFENEEQDIFVHDLYTNTFHDLRNSPYSFTSEEGVFDDRFEIVFLEETLSLTDEDKNAFKVFQNNTLQNLTVLNPNSQDIKSVNLIDISGKQIFNATDLSIQTRYTFSTANLSDGVYITTVTLGNDNTITEKVIISNKQ